MESIGGIVTGGGSIKQSHDFLNVWSFTFLSDSPKILNDTNF